MRSGEDGLYSGVYCREELRMILSFGVLSDVWY